MQCRSQSSSYTSGNMHTKQTLYSSSEMFLCLQDQWRLQAMIYNTLHSLKLPAELFGTHSLRIGSATAVAEARIPMRIIKAMGRWSSDVYRSYIRTPHRILRSLTNQQILRIIELHEQVYWLLSLSCYSHRLCDLYFHAIDAFQTKKETREKVTSRLH